MNIERTDDLVHRAAVHKALGDPGRLALVDALALGDAAPSDLAALLGLPSNLLAHHVGVLIRAGVVRRLPSEGDRRRSYLALVAGGLDGLLPTPTLPGRRVVFVCTENAARSQLAAALWRARCPLPAESAGTHPAPRVHPGAVAAARRHRLAMAPGTPTHLSQVRRTGDIVITVCDRAHEELDGSDSSGAAHWSIPDPARLGDAAAFDAAFDELSDRISRLAPHVAPPRRQS
ncbi:MAG: arsenate reductase/protein-tyrosine-phosphatase family protein [Sporichthyaceae bacterium]